MRKVIDFFCHDSVYEITYKLHESKESIAIS